MIRWCLISFTSKISDELFVSGMGWILFLPYCGTTQGYGVSCGSGGLGCLYFAKVVHA